MTTRAITVLTWNLQGSEGVDIAAVAAVIRQSSPDVVLLQEIQRRQCRRLARSVGMSYGWRLKHLHWRTWPEGLALVSPHHLGGVRRVLLRRSLLWTWRRRIAVLGRVDVGGGVHVANVHLSPYDEDARLREAERVVAAAPGAIIGGDCNDEPGGAAPQVFERAGWRDAWCAQHPDDAGGATNWTAGDRRGRSPTQRLDYVWLPPSLEAVAARVPVPADALDDFARLSDHLPVVVSARTIGGAS